MTSHGVADTDHDRDKYFSTFVEPQRDYVDPRPALMAAAYWDWKDAVELDNEAGELQKEIRAAAGVLVATLGESRLD